MLQFEFTDVPPESSQWWIVVSAQGIDVCDEDPGFDVRVAVETDLRTLTLAWRGDLTWAAASRSGELELRGASQDRRALPGWLKLSDFATVPRPTPGLTRADV